VVCRRGATAVVAFPALQEVRLKLPRSFLAATVTPELAARVELATLAPGVMAGKLSAVLLVGAAAAAACPTRPASQAIAAGLQYVYCSCPSNEYDGTRDQGLPSRGGLNSWREAPGLSFADPSSEACGQFCPVAQTHAQLPRCTPVAQMHASCVDMCDVAAAATRL
jgi:hypothetical protein